MTLREWTAKNYKSKSTPRWALAVTIKFLIEGTLSLFYGGIITVLIFIPVRFNYMTIPLNAATPLALWATLSAMIMGGIMWCQYTEEDPREEGRTEQQELSESIDQETETESQ